MFYLETQNPPKPKSLTWQSHSPAGSTQFRKHWTSLQHGMYSIRRGPKPKDLPFVCSSHLSNLLLAGTPFDSSSPLPRAPRVWAQQRLWSLSLGNVWQAIISVCLQKPYSSIHMNMYEQDVHRRREAKMSSSRCSCRFVCVLAVYCLDSGPAPKKHIPDEV